MECYGNVFLRHRENITDTSVPGNLHIRRISTFELIITGNLGIEPDRRTGFNTKRLTAGILQAEVLHLAVRLVCQDLHRIRFCRINDPAQRHQPCQKGHRHKKREKLADLVLHFPFLLIK